MSPIIAGAIMLAIVAVRICKTKDDWGAVLGCCFGCSILFGAIALIGLIFD